MHTAPSSAAGQALCARCASNGTSCCSADPAEAHLFFPLSVAEWQRLLPYTARIPHDTKQQAMRHADDDLIRESEPNSYELLSAMVRLFPQQKQKVQELFPLAGRHFRLRITATGDCIFLASTGCVLPREVRPWYCLLFPNWVKGTGTTFFVVQGCLIAQQAHGAADACRLLGTNAQEVHTLYHHLQKDWGLLPT